MKSSFLNLKDVCASYGYNKDWVLRGLSVQLDKGESLGIVGDNGSGKSTLAHALIGVIPYITPGQVTGRAYLDDKDLFHEHLDGRLSRVGYSFQDVESQILFGKVSDVLGLNENESDVLLLKRSIDDLDVGHLVERSPDKLSSGESQRIALITALRRGPGLVIYDEAISALDPKARHLFGKLIRNLQADGRSIILLGQRPEMLEPYCHRVLQLENGRLGSRSRPTKSQLRERAEGFWRTLQEHTPQPRHCPPLSLNDVKFSWGRSGLKLGPINLSITPGENIAILGPNGSGKTTLFLLMMGALRASSGIFTLGHRQFRSAKTPPWAEAIAMVFQSPLTQFLGATIEEELTATVFAETRSEDDPLRSLLLNHFSYLEFTKDPLELSYGQQRILSFITTLLSQHCIFLLEEPEQGLDSTSLEYIKVWLRENRKERIRSVLFSTHDLSLAAELADRCILMVNGKLVNQISTNDPAKLADWYFLHTEKQYKYDRC